VTLSQQLKVIAEEKQQPLKTIAVSAHVFNEDIAKFIESGFDGFVAKPVQMKKLKPAIAKVMFNVEGLANQETEQIIEQVKSVAQENDLPLIQSAELGSTMAISEDDLIDFSQFLLFDANIPNQDIEYLGSDKVKQLTQLFCQQVNSEYSDFSGLSAVDQKAKIHKLKGAAIGLGLVRLYQLCQQLEVSLKGESLKDEQLLMIATFMHQSKDALNEYAKDL